MDANTLPALLPSTDEEQDPQVAAPADRQMLVWPQDATRRRRKGRKSAERMDGMME